MTIRPLDHQIYTQEISPWLPENILDFHLHVSHPDNCGLISPERFKSIWAIEVGIHQTWEELDENYQILFPDKKVVPLAFGGVYKEIDQEADNRYLLEGIKGRGDRFALYTTRPDFTTAQIEKAFEAGFMGLKPYPDLTPHGSDERPIYDFLPHEHLECLNDFGGVLMLHLPRKGRLADKDNIRETAEISDKYPNVKIVLAHIGRAYCLPNAEQGINEYKDSSNIYTDISANVNSDVFELAIKTFGLERILFGSDLPITTMRMEREHVGNTYINYTDGDYSWNTNRKSPEEEAKYTFFLYQELRAFLKAAKACGLTKEDMQKVFWDNGMRLLGRQ